MTTLGFERRGDIGVLTLNRPDRLNAQTLAMWREMRAWQIEIERCPAPLRCLVVHGAGRAFSAGLDRDELHPEGDTLAAVAELGEAPVMDLIEGIQAVFRWFRDAPFPTIAAVHGYALGAGFQLAVACDLRVFDTDSMGGLPEASLGLLPDLGAMAYLPAIIGDGRAREMMFTGRRYSADEALACGLANRVGTFDAALALAHDVADASPMAHFFTKQALGAGAESSFECARRGQAACLLALRARRPVG